MSTRLILRNVSNVFPNFQPLSRKIEPKIARGTIRLSQYCTTKQIFFRELVDCSERRKQKKRGENKLVNQPLWNFRVDQASLILSRGVAEREEIKTD